MLRSPRGRRALCGAASCEGAFDRPTLHADARVPCQDEFRELMRCLHARASSPALCAGRMHDLKGCLRAHGLLRSGE